MNSRHRFGWRKGVFVAVTALLLTACASNGPNSTDSSQGPIDESLPARIVDAGEIIAATNATYPPIEYFDDDDKTIIGFDPDLGAAIGKELGVPIRFINVTDLESIIPGLASGRYDIAMSFNSDIKERYDRVHFVDYFSDGALLVVKKGNPEGIHSFDDLCGKTVVVQKGSLSEVRPAEMQDEACKKESKPGLDIVQLPQATDKQLQVQSGRAAAAITNVSNANFQVQQAPDRFEVVGEPVTPPGALIGIGIPAKETQLRDAIQGALQRVIASGEYDRLIEKYGLQSGALKTAQINGDR
jgi:polar amino acid transport system substrate-binding protein